MYLFGEQPAYADAWVNRLQGIASQLLLGIAPAGPALDLEPGADLGALQGDSHLYLIDSGLVQARINERPLFYLQDGDLLGLYQNREDLAYQYSTDGVLRVVPYLRSEVLAHIHATPHTQELLIEYLTGQTTLLCDAITRLKQPEYRASNGFKHVAAGDVLIHQGDEADHVFVIIEGHAEAFVDGHKVGDVPKDEIFGAMAIFTHEKRSATVVASEPCTLMIIPKDQFLSLTQTNPRIAHSLIESMARRIDALNRQVTRLIGSP
ncbi:cyclic nucleotide-binding protein [Pseudomonas sp. M47T1]|uniref:Crp/Fnr family transcriptional regulator n=1 Tax=unclassified Pseudomonas TaxID=196821 RepID=UPI000260843B|nr:cyclic nucleotide-binding domain-containing protein [Pseudomonas sp. M47T1]EIK93194.1 cyclic nucleotide-binding protein [Pseudomonas sp. M47T1]